MFDFPNSPTNGQSVTGPNGNTFVFNSTTGVWGASGSASPLAIAFGGTGATTAAGALTNLGAAPINSPTLTGTPTAPTAAPGTNTTQVATTAFAVAGDALRVAKAGDTMTGPLTINSGPALGLNIQTAAVVNGFVGLGLTNGSPGGRSYYVTSTDTAAGAGGGKFGVFDNTAGAYRLLIDSSGNATFSGTIISGNYTPPTVPQNGSVILAGQLTIASGQLCGNLYYDGSNFRYLATSGGVSCYLSPTNSSWTWYSVPSGTAGAIAPLTQTMILDSSGNLTASNVLQGLVLRSSIGSGAQAWVSMQVQGVHEWKCLTENSNGAFHIQDVTVVQNRLEIDTAGNCKAWTAWGTFSDAELKTDITDNPHGLAEILKIQPRRFRYRGPDMPEKGQGFIAQELAEIMPELIGEMTLDDTGKTAKTVTETGLIGPLVNAVKELAAEVEALKKRIK